MDKMELKALGKINLGLDVLGRRENGYHDVRMVMQTVYLYDQIVITNHKMFGTFHNDLNTLIEVFLPFFTCL